MNINRILITGLATALVVSGANASGVSTYAGLNLGSVFGETTVSRQQHTNATVEGLLKIHEPKSRKKCHFISELLVGAEGILKGKLVGGLELIGSKRLGKIRIPYDGFVTGGGAHGKDSGSVAAEEVLQKAGNGVGKTDNICIKHKWGLSPLAKIGFLIKDHFLIGVLGGVSVNSYKLSYTVDDQVKTPTEAAHKKTDAIYDPMTGTSVHHKETTKLRPVVGAIMEYRINKCVALTLQYRCEFKTKYELPHQLSDQTTVNTITKDSVNTHTAENAFIYATNGISGGNAKAVQTANHIITLGVRLLGFLSAR
ncbi:MAG: hypothetical protein LBF56_01205 [Holosporales bacterium]|jgi:opacity protein-like surface antigen|nr:hypothetical protein [Holosporales bacterium]